MDKYRRLTRKKAIARVGLAIVFLLLFILFLTNVLYFYFSLKSMFFLTLIIDYIFLALVIIFYFQKKVIINIIRHYQDIIKIEDSLVTAGVYIDNGTYLEVPRITIKYDRNEVIISMSNLFFRKKLESMLDSLSSALPNRWICRRKYFDKGENNLIIEYADITEENRLVFDTMDDFESWLSGDDFLIDKNISFSLEDYPHILITGTTGSGKSYFAQNLILQARYNNYQVSILDIKGTYRKFRYFFGYADTIDGIKDELSRAILELHDRKRDMADFLDKHPNRTASDYGYDPYLVVFEEYLAFCNSGIDKKTLAEVEKMLLEITTTGRQFGLHLMIITQVSSANSLSTSLRANLSAKFLLGTADETILKTTFGLGTSTAYRKKMEKGEGLCCFDIDILPFKSITLNVSDDEIDEFVGRCPDPRLYMR